MILRTATICGLVFALAGVVGAQARDFEMGGDNQYPYSIMAPEPGTHSQTKPVKNQSIAPISQRVPRHLYNTARGSSGSALPTPLPKTQLIPPEGSGRLTLPAVPSEQGPTILQGVARPIPSLPHGPESFQDRASRCSFQAGLYNVPGNLTTQYMGSCVN